MILHAGQHLSFYEILGPLGSGGMGEVYRARDTRLGREVAIKMLHESLCADPERRARFRREARAVAQLGHPHIAQIFDVGEAEGCDFLAFERIEGETLAERAARKRLEVGELVDLVAPLADALSYAHERGIVHRDLKAANVMVTAQGHAKLLDFGLAKVAEEGEEGEEGRKATTLTQEGAVFGTPTAMSPEQALGKPLDPRSDVFSFGSLLYELLGGRPAFAGDTVLEVLDAVVHREPPPIERLRPDVPGELAAIVRKALRKDPRERYQTMADLSADLRHVKRESQDALAAPPRRRFLTPARVVALAGVAAAGLLLAWLLGRGGEPAAVTGGPGYVAVMYFDSTVSGPGSEELGDMLTHLVTTELTRDPELDVLSQQRLFELARRAGREDGRVDAAVASEIAASAHLSRMVVGRVARVGDRLLASASVVDAGSGRELASGQARGSGIDDVFEMAEELGGALRSALRPQASPGGSPAAGPEARVTSSVDAYREFLAGFRFLQLQDFVQALEHLGAATELDPRFAQAYYWDATASAWSALHERQVRSIERASAFRELLPADELRALPAADLFHHARLIEARPELERLVAEDPDNRDAWYMLGEVYLHSPADADATRAAHAFERTLEIDPTFSLVHSHLVHAWLLAGDGAKAREVQERLLRPGDADYWPTRVAFASWSEDPTWARGATLTEDRPDDLLGQWKWLGLAQVGLAFGGWPDAQAWLEGHLADGGAPLRLLPEDMRIWLVASLHQRLVLLGRFAEAAPLREALPPPSALAGTNSYAAGMLADTLLLDADRVRLLGDDREALARILAVTEALEAPRARWVAVELSLALGRDDVVRDQLTALERLTAAGALRTGTYLELARAEVDLAAGRAEVARATFERALAADRVNQDGFANAVTAAGRLLDAELRAVRAAGDRDAELALLRRIVDRRMLRATDPIVWRRAQLDLAGRELEAGDAASARDHLDDLLDAWGASGAALPEVLRARELRASAGAH